MTEKQFTTILYRYHYNQEGMTWKQLTTIFYWHYYNQSDEMDIDRTPQSQPQHNSSSQSSRGCCNRASISSYWTITVMPPQRLNKWRRSIRQILQSGGRAPWPQPPQCSTQQLQVNTRCSSWSSIEASGNSNSKRRVGRSSCKRAGAYGDTITSWQQDGHNNKYGKKQRRNSLTFSLTILQYHSFVLQVQYFNLSVQRWSSGFVITGSVL